MNEGFVQIIGYQQLQAKPRLLFLEPERTVDVFLTDSHGRSRSFCGRLKLMRDGLLY